MEALGRFSKAPLAPLIGYEPDAAVLGAPFFVMEFVDGEVPREDSPHTYTREGFFVDAAPEERRRMLESGLHVLAEVHTVDWHDAGLEWLVPPGTTPGIAAQLDLWERFTRRELRDRVHPALDEGFAWLRANLPTNLAVGLSWGDSRPGNMIWRDFRCVCIMDFENIAIAPPEIDLGWWLMFDRCTHEGVGVDRLPGEPTREELRDFYAACAGREVGNTYYFEVFAAMRYAAIVVRIMNRWVDRGDLPADQMIWLQNPAADCLADLLRVPHPQRG
jgi:aminoglycoside phosphotransferase (APT) family kinase protein